MTGFHWRLHCILTTRPDAYGFTGLLLGVLVAAVVAFRVPLVGSVSIDGRIGGALGLVFGVLGVFLGETFRVYWTGACELP